MNPELEIQLIALVVAVASALPGVFLILRQMAMMTDAITHTILLGIVIAFFLTGSLSSPLLIVGAALMGLFTVFLTEVLNNTGLVSKDSAIGIVFPLLFSIAIIIISKYAGNVHIDTDSVLLGQIEFAPFDRFVIAGRDLGPKALYTMLGILIINLIFVLAFFKELKIVTFDRALAAVLGISPILIHYLLMGVVSITAVGAFEAVGSILVIAFMVGPPVTAYLLTDDLKIMLILSSIIGGINGLLGFRLAMYYDISIAGSMAFMTGLVFALVFILAPKRGLITTITRRRVQKNQFAANSLLFHILNHEGEDDADYHNNIENIEENLNWSNHYVEKIIGRLKTDGKVNVRDGNIYLTDFGRNYAIESYEEIVGSLKKL